MDSKTLKRVLNSIGKGCFIKYFEEFKDPSNSKEKLIEQISSTEKYDEGATLTRVNSARRIFKYGMENEALDLIINSKRIEFDVKQKAISYKDKGFT